MISSLFSQKLARFWDCKITAFPLIFDNLLHLVDGAKSLNLSMQFDVVHIYGRQRLRCKERPETVLWYGMQYPRGRRLRAWCSIQLQASAYTRMGRFSPESVFVISPCLFMTQTLVKNDDKRNQKQRDSHL